MRQNLENTPYWLKKRLSLSADVFETKKILSGYSVNTVCESSLCPNLNECFSRRFATFLILGKVCTRSCGFCCVERRAFPAPVDPDEPERISAAAKELGLRHVIITSVTRDDLADGGAAQFVKSIEAAKRISKGIKVEVLIPDFGAYMKSVERVVKAGPDIFSHNIETVKRLYPAVRPVSDYSRSLRILSYAKEIAPDIVTKSAILVGLGEQRQEVIETMEDLNTAGCSIVTLGQYLRPGHENLPVKKFITPEEFEHYKKAGERMGFKYVSAGPFVRSSYLADQICGSPSLLELGNGNSGRFANRSKWKSLVA